MYFFNAGSDSEGDGLCGDKQTGMSAFCVGSFHRMDLSGNKPLYC